MVDLMDRVKVEMMVIVLGRYLDCLLAGLMAYWLAGLLAILMETHLVETLVEL